MLHCCSSTSLNLSTLHYSLKGMEMWDALVFRHFVSWNAETVSNQIIPACKGRQKPNQEHRFKTAWRKVNNGLVDCSCEGLVPLLHLQCSDLYFLSWDNVGVFFQWVIMWVSMRPPTHRSSVFCEKQCLVGLTLSCLTADFNVQWAAMIACTWESNDGYETQFRFLFPS